MQTAAESQLLWLQNLEELGEALFGSRTTVSARKVWSLLLYTGGVSNFADNNEAAFRCLSSLCCYKQMATRL